MKVLVTQKLTRIKEKLIEPDLRIWFGILVIIALILLFWDISEPFYGHYDWTGASFSLRIRKSYELNDFRYIFNYTHHPPLLQIILYVIFVLFGISEMVARLPFILFSLGSVIFFFLLSKKMLDDKQTIIATLIFIISPMFIYFGRNVGHEALVLCFLLATVYFYYVFQESNDPKYLLILCMLTFFGIFAGWAYYFWPWVMFCFELISKQKNKKKIVLLVIFMVLTIFGVIFNILIFAFMKQVKIEVVVLDLLSAGERRSGLPQNLFQVSRIFFEKYLLYFTPFILVIAYIFYSDVLWNILNEIRDKLKKKVNRKSMLDLMENSDKIIVVLTLVGILHILIFLNGAIIHEFWAFYLTPGLVLAYVTATKRFNKRINVSLLVATIPMLLLANVYLHQLDRPEIYRIGVYIDSLDTQDDLIYVATPQIAYYFDAQYITIIMYEEWLKERINNDTETFPKFIVINDGYPNKDAIQSITSNYYLNQTLWGNSGWGGYWVISNITATGS